MSIETIHQAPQGRPRKPRGTQPQPVFPRLFLSVKELSARYGVTPVSIWRWVREGKFPAPVKLSGNATRWQIASIEQFERERGAA